MKLLFDENLSYKIVTNLTDVFPDAKHVRDLNLLHASDEQIWETATMRNLTIVTKDTDFSQRVLLRGSPPKVIQIRLGNCSSGQIESLLRWRADSIRMFLEDTSLSILDLS